MAWTTPDDLVAQLRRRWDRGELLAHVVRASSLFPLRLRFSAPGARDLDARFAEVRAWVEALRAASSERRGWGYTLEWTEHNPRGTGRNAVPSGVVVPTLEDALRLLGREAEATAFRNALESTLPAFPTLAEWFARAPQTAVDHAAHWADVLRVLAWFRAHPRSGLYIRQVDAGVDTKFIERNRRLFGELLPLVCESSEAPVDSFEARFGLATKPLTLRLRTLDPALRIAGLDDVSAPVTQLASLPLSPKRVFVTENEINGLSFPLVEGAVVVFGLGYGLLRLGAVPWLRPAFVHYWGDIDTHGFAMLDRLRQVVPHASSLLMDEATLLEHRTAWVREAEQERRDLDGLTDEERRVYDGLRFSRYGEQVRLEQERIRFGRLRAALEKL